LLPPAFVQASSVSVLRSIKSLLYMGLCTLYLAGVVGVFTDKLVDL
jgi:hypothetical protein